MKKIIVVSTSVLLLLLFVPILLAQQSSEKNGKDLHPVIKQALKVLNELDLLPSVAQEKIVIIKNLKPWLRDTGYSALPPERLNIHSLDESLAFVLTAHPSGQPKQLPYFPLYFRMDTDFWNEMVAPANGSHRLVVGFVAGLMAHELVHARGSESEVTALGVQAAVLKNLRNKGMFSGPSADGHIADIQNALADEKRQLADNR